MEPDTERVHRMIVAEPPRKGSLCGVTSHRGVGEGGI